MRFDACLAIPGLLVGNRDGKAGELCSTEAKWATGPCLIQSVAAATSDGNS